MKTFIKLIPILLLFDVSILFANEESINENNIEIDSIVVYYLDWDLRTRVRLSCNDVKNFNNGKNDVYVIKDKEIIGEFVKALSLIELSLIMKKENADIRMVLDFYSSGMIKKEICLNYTRAIFIDNNLYRSKSLFYLIENEIPETTAPF